MILSDERRGWVLKRAMDGHALHERGLHAYPSKDGLVVGIAAIDDALAAGKELPVFVDLSPAQASYLVELVEWERGAEARNEARRLADEEARARAPEPFLRNFTGEDVLLTSFVVAVKAIPDDATREAFAILLEALRRGVKADNPIRGA